MKIGYSKNYAQNGNCGLLFERDDVLAEIDRQEVELIKKTGYSKEQAQYEYEQARKLAMKINQPSAAATNILGKARLHGLDHDAGPGAAGLTINVTTDRKVIENKEIEDEV